MSRGGGRVLEGILDRGMTYLGEEFTWGDWEVGANYGFMSVRGIQNK